MPDFPDEEIAAIERRLLRGMQDYKKAAGDGCDYTDQDINECKRIVEAYLSNVRENGPKTEQAIRDAVKKTVLELNGLNEKSSSLIETDQREDLCEIIQIAARYAGLQTDEDITEAWREW